MASYMIKRIDELVRNREISFDSIGCNRFMDYYGSMNDIVRTLEKAFKKSALEKDLDFFLYANRLLSGIIDYGLRTKEDVLGLKHSIEDFCLECYRGDYEASHRILRGLELKREILESPVLEKKDRISWAAFEPRLTKKLVRKIRPKGVEDYLPDYVILDGHDAYRPGIMLASSFDTMRICAIRNAQDSKRDNSPKPLTGEEEYLRPNLYNKDILIMGEDSSTGKAISSLFNLVIKVSRPRHILTAVPIFIPGDPLQIKLNYFAESRTSFG